MRGLQFGNMENRIFPLAVRGRPTDKIIDERIKGMRKVSQKDFLCRVIMLSIIFVWFITDFIYSLALGHYIRNCILFLCIILVFFPFVYVLKRFIFLSYLLEDELQCGTLEAVKSRLLHRIEIRYGGRRYRTGCLFALRVRSSVNKNVTFVVDKNGRAYIVDIL